MSTTTEPMDYADLQARHERYHERYLSGASVSRIPADQRPPTHATAKQLQVLQALALLRFASVTNLMDFTGRKERRVQETMAQLRSKNLVAWFRWVDTRNVPDGMDPLTTTPVYCLTTKGAHRCILDRVIQDDKYLLTRTWKGKPVLHSTMPHQLGIVDITLGMSIAARKSTTHELEWAVPDFVFEDIDGTSRIATTENMGTDNELRADLIACVRAKNLGRLFTLYTELERKSKTAKKIINKLDNYSALFKSKNRRFDQGAPVLLYVVTDCSDPNDTKQRVKLVRSWVKNKAVAPAFRITTLEKITKDAFGQIWQKVDGSTWGIGG